MARINKSQFAILGCLSIRPMSAYEIKKFIAKSIAYFWAEGEGQLYPTLKKLEQDKAVGFKEEVSAKGGIKKTYFITKKGKMVLLEWINKKVDRSVYRNELLLKLFFGANQPVENNINLIEEARNDCSITRKILQTIKAGLKEKDLSKNRLPYAELTLDYGIDMLAAEINWCLRSLKKLKNL